MSKRVQMAFDPFNTRLSGELRIAYAAGLFDGEGCVHIACQKKRAAVRGCVYRLNVTMAQNHLGTLVDFQNLVGVKGRIYHRVRTGTSNRDHYCLTYDGSAAEALLTTLLPYLHRKRDEALIALEFQQRTELQRHFGPKGCPAHIWEHRKSLYKKLRNLK